MAIQHDGWSIVAQYRKCGKPGCTACAEGRGHGPYYYGTKTVDGRHVSHYFGKNAPGDDIQENSQEEIVALHAELDVLRQENTRLRARVEELQSQLATAPQPSPAKSEDGAKTPVKAAAAVEYTHDDKTRGLTANQQAVLSALRQECEGNHRVTALSLGRKMGLPNRQASSRTLPVLRRLVALGYAEEIERNKFKPLIPEATPRSSHDSLVVDDTQELTRAQVKDIWRHETASIDADQDVLNEAHESFLRGLFRGAQDEHTRIRVGKEPRPYVCPFRTSGRGAHRAFGNVERLVRTAVPWVVNNVASQRHRSEEAHRKADERTAQQRQRYERMPLAELVEMRDRMEASLQAESNLGWTLSLDELKEQFRFVEQALMHRGE